MPETTSMGRVPVGDPIPLRFDPQTKQHLEEVAAGIGPRRFGALVRVAAHRLLADPDRVPTALDEYRRVSAVARSLPRVEIFFDLDPATDRRLEDLARAHHTKRSAIVRVAAHRFLTAAGRFRPHVLREDARDDLTHRTRLHVNPSTLDRLTGRNGDVLTAAALRVALRRLLDDPGDLTADLTTIGAVRDLAPEIFGPRTNVHFDDDLRDQLDALAHRLGSDRGELMRLAAQQLLAHPRDLEQAVTDEIYRGESNRGQLLARNECRKTTTTAAATGPAGAVKAPSPAGRPFGKPHSFLVDEDTKRRLHELADEYGPRRVSALVRVGIRRLLDNPGNLTADLTTVAPVHDLRPEPPKARNAVALDDELLVHLDALAGRLGPTRQELVSLAATRILRQHAGIETLMLDEMYRAPGNRQKLISRHARREPRRRTGHGDGA
ncbi:CopG family transcriptional regulator (plasmid) [Rhodococcus sp. ZPP]|uniref:ribbon-helix-helix domain-containing protein n=1 Tax=Rhodococcus TaxID=1827 RepID=UPI0006BB500E|nr:MULTISPECIES: CopG family transcriptional regulator [Rhodococcus]QHE73683.1 hypothetical protein GFS60_07347 [Rhodococcus sp. WAY2]QTJ71161.1 CopG family transcriptional regulator [Rhodococcus sp. ZPP]